MAKAIESVNVSVVMDEPITELVQAAVGILHVVNTGKMVAAAHCQLDCEDAVGALEEALSSFVTVSPTEGHDVPSLPCQECGGLGFVPTRDAILPCIVCAQGDGQR